MTTYIRNDDPRAAQLCSESAAQSLVSCAQCSIHIDESQRRHWRGVFRALHTSCVKYGYTVRAGTIVPTSTTTVQIGTSTQIEAMPPYLTGRPSSVTTSTYITLIAYSSATGSLDQTSASSGTAPTNSLLPTITAPKKGTASAKNISLFSVVAMGASVLFV